LTDHVEAKVFAFPFEMEQLMLWRKTDEGYDVEVLRRSSFNDNIERQEWKSVIVDEMTLRTVTKGPQGEQIRVTETFSPNGDSVMVGEVEANGK
jgi:hypothetical protein